MRKTRSPARKKFWRAVAYIFNFLSRKSDGSASRNELVGGDHPGVTREAIDEGLDLLVKQRALAPSYRLAKQRYILNRENTANFLILQTEKDVYVSPERNRSATARWALMAQRSGVRSREIGVVYWKERGKAPKAPGLRIYGVKADDLLDKSKSRQIKVSVERPKTKRGVTARQGVNVSLRFNPALEAGQVVEYKFNTYTPRHYAASAEEAKEEFGYEWIREGIHIDGPAISMKITVRLPESYKYQEARVEKDGTVSNRANTPGKILKRFNGDPKTLTYNAKRPKQGSYYVCWLLPPKSSAASSQTASVD